MNWIVLDFYPGSWLFFVLETRSGYSVEDVIGLTEAKLVPAWEEKGAAAAGMVPDPAGAMLLFLGYGARNNRHKKSQSACADWLLMGTGMAGILAVAGLSLPGWPTDRIRPLHRCGP